MTPAVPPDSAGDGGAPGDEERMRQAVAAGGGRAALHLTQPVGGVGAVLVSRLAGRVFTGANLSLRVLAMPKIVARTPARAEGADTAGATLYVTLELCAIRAAPRRGAWTPSSPPAWPALSSG